MNLIEKEILLPKANIQNNLLTYLKKNLLLSLSNEKLSYPLRVVITDSLNSNYKCEISVIKEKNTSKEDESIFDFRKRSFENTKHFVVVLIVPTGIGCEIGGHAGDATPVARMLASSCDMLISHPNVFNASDIIEMPDNCLYVEGSSICRLMMGTLGLSPVRKNKILVAIDNSYKTSCQNFSINSVNAARAVLGIDCLKIITLPYETSMKTQYSSSKRAIGVIQNLDYLFSILNDQKDYDAIAVSSVIQAPKNYYRDYFLSQGTMINPWGGVEAMLTHAISYRYNIPSAHAPMIVSGDVLNMDTGVVDARMSAEVVSKTFFHSVLKGLHTSPKMVTDHSLFLADSVLSVEDVSCLVIPDKCLGLPVIAALEQGITVIAVKENKNLMKNNLSELPWKKGQFFYAENYMEAIGILTAIREGINPSSGRRPFNTLKMER